MFDNRLEHTILSENLRYKCVYGYDALHCQVSGCDPRFGGYVLQVSGFEPDKSEKKVLPPWILVSEHYIHHYFAFRRICS